MIKTSILTMMTVLTLGAAIPALASTTSGATSEHSGFGHEFFVNRAPAGLNDPVAYADNMDAAAAMANDIEPAGSDTKSAKTR